MDEIKLLLDLLDDYIKKIETYVFYTDKPQYVTIHDYIFDLMQPTRILKHSIYQLTPDEVQQTIKKLNAIKEEISAYITERGIDDEILNSEYNKILLSIVDNNKNEDKLTEEDKVIDIEQQIDSLPTATLSDVPELEGVQNLDSSMRL